MLQQEAGTSIETAFFGNTSGTFARDRPMLSERVNRAGDRASQFPLFALPLTGGVVADYPNAKIRRIAPRPNS